ncbi:hypothetical protein [Anaerosporobacter faecicola]|uniref:hypothetical protein n=1 Tax=Anaerosporobacter faecicola TaxID=2718714 RepID=UPI00143C8C95|nr:hypothetical protein [Anaerosporobacter faecicola]
MEKIKFENYIYEKNGSIRKFQALSEEEKKEMHRQMFRILQERTNLTCSNESANKEKE